MATTGGFTFTTAVRVIDGVHRDTAVMRPLPHPALASRLAEADVFVLDVADLPDRRGALHRYPANFTRRQLQQSVIGLARNQLSLSAGRPGHLPALARLQLDVVND